MGRYLSVDMGSTSTTALVLDTERARVEAFRSLPNERETTTAADRTRGRSEWDLAGMVEDAVALCRRLLQAVPGGQIDGIGVTGQQQGCQLLDRSGALFGPLISWQDRRADEPTDVSGDGRSCLAEIAELGEAERFAEGMPRLPRTGTPLHPKHAAAQLFWLQSHDSLPAHASTSSVPDYLVHRLTDEAVAVEPTNAQGWGVYDVYARGWALDLMSNLGLPQSLLPPLTAAATVAGHLTAAIAERLGLPAGIPVAVASGDHQCAFVGAVDDHRDSVAINVGTGGQMSAFLEAPLEPGWLELRPAIQAGYLLTGASAVGGRSIRYLRDFVLGAAELVGGGATIGGSGEQDRDLVYQRLVAEAMAAGPGAGGVRCSPLFSGGANAPSRRASFEGLDAGNFTPGNLARALLNGMAEALHADYRHALERGVTARRLLVGSGNGLRLNPVLREELARRFDQRLQMGRLNEEAAVGAALCAAVAVGEFGSVAEASAGVLATAHGPT